MNYRFLICAFLCTHILFAADPERRLTRAQRRALRERSSRRQPKECIEIPEGFELVISADRGALLVPIESLENSDASVRMKAIEAAEPVEINL